MSVSAKEMAVKVICNPARLKRIAINCRCNTRTVHEIPGEALDGAGVCVVECPTCHQEYALAPTGTLRRVNKTPEGGYVPGAIVGVKSAVIEGDYVDDDGQLSGKVVMPPAKGMN